MSNCHRALDKSPRIHCQGDPGQAQYSPLTKVVIRAERETPAPPFATLGLPRQPGGEIMSGKPIADPADIIVGTPAMCVAGWCVCQQLLTEMAASKFLSDVFERASEQLERLAKASEGRVLGLAREMLSGVFASSTVELSKQGGQKPNR
jgi:hypothetical protein